MITVICWSKDRAAQLDLTLSTYKKYFKEWKEQTLNIIYTYSNDFYKQGYDLIKQYHPEFNWILETNFKNDTLKCLNSDKLLTSFIVDDDVFIDYFSMENNEIKEFLNNDTITCVSPRLGLHINFCYTQNKPQPQPQLDEKRMWNWTKNCVHDWNYPSSVASFHLFRTRDILFLNNTSFRAPNSLESEFNNYYPRNKEFMICFENAKCFCSAPNRVQTENNNLCLNTYSIDFLNKEFLNNKRLSPDINHNMKINMCHGPIKLIFI